MIHISSIHETYYDRPSHMKPIGTRLSKDPEVKPGRLNTYSNINGLGQIRILNVDISVKFEETRLVPEREKN